MNSSTRSNDTFHAMLLFNTALLSFVLLMLMVTRVTTMRPGMCAEGWLTVMAMLTVVISVCLGKRRVWRRDLWRQAVCEEGHHAMASVAWCRMEKSHKRVTTDRQVDALSLVILSGFRAAMSLRSALFCDP